MRQQETLVADPLVNRLLDCLPDPTMILNSKRQIVLANERTLELLGAPRDRILGLRIGEAIQCPRAHENPGGCGTTSGCRYCGAVRAIMNCQTAHVADVQECRVESWLTGEPVALDLRVSAAPFCCQGEDFTVCVLHDITDEKRRQVLERIFFHDLLNSAGSLKAMAEMFGQLHGEEEKSVKQAIWNLSGQVVEEIRSQRDLVAAEAGDLAVTILDVNVSELLDRIYSQYAQSSAADNKQLILIPIKQQPVIWTDEVLLGRVLGNLIKNAARGVRSWSNGHRLIREQKTTTFFDSQPRGDARTRSVSGLPALVQHQAGERPRRRHL